MTVKEYLMKCRSLVLMAVLFALPSATLAEIVTLYEDDFSGSTSSNLLGTVTDVGDGIWTSGGASASFKADGSVVTNTAGSGVWLPVSIEQGNVYTLSADVDLTAGSWITLGYAQYGSDAAFWGSGGYGTVAVNSSFSKVFPGQGTEGELPAFIGAGAGVQQLQIVLDAIDVDSANWTMEFFEGGVSVGGPVTTTNGNFANISFVGFTTAREWKNQALSAIPCRIGKNEIVAMKPLPEGATAFMITAKAGGVWNDGYVNSVLIELK